LNLLQTKKNEFTLVQLLKFSIGAAKGMEYLHAQKIIHSKYTQIQCIGDFVDN
jgi:hypothetical protein